MFVWKGSWVFEVVQLPVSQALGSGGEQCGLPGQLQDCVCSPQGEHTKNFWPKEMWDRFR